MHTPYHIHMYGIRRTCVRHAMSLWRKLRPLGRPCVWGGGGWHCLLVVNRKSWLNHVIWEIKLYAMENLVNCILFKFSLQPMMHMFNYFQLNHVNWYHIQLNEFFQFKFELFFSNSVVNTHSCLYHPLLVALFLSIYCTLYSYILVQIYKISVAYHPIPVEFYLSIHQSS
jgi:hypothetical protein